MPAPQNNQGFVQPQTGGTGNWLSKLFGGIGDGARARSMAQLQLDLHAGKADIDTFHKKERTTWDMATKDAFAESGFERSGREIDRGIKVGPDMGRAGVLGFDKNGRPTMQRTGQKQGKAADTTGAKIDNNTPPPPPPPPGPPPTDRANNPARKAKTRNATLKDTTAALSAGKIDQEQAADMSPTYARNLGKKTASKSVINSDSGVIKQKPEPAGPERWPGYGPTYDGAGNNTLSPEGKAYAAKKTRSPRAPKAGA
jgi:hypothetical protein